MATHSISASFDYHVDGMVQDVLGALEPDLSLVHPNMCSSQSAFLLSREGLLGATFSDGP